MKDVEKEADVKDVHVSVMALNANNAALVRRYVKWTAPTACGTKGASIGFSDWLGEADAVVAELFGKRQLKPVLVIYYRGQRGFAALFCTGCGVPQPGACSKRATRKATALMLPA